MTLYDFNKHISSKIVERGRQLFLQNKVIVIDDEKDEIFGLVRGKKDTYVTTLSFDGSGNIKKCSCTCPYIESYNSPCKHLAAFMFYIRSDKASAQKKSIPKTNSKTKANANPANGSSKSVLKLISEFGTLSELSALTADPEEQARIIPELSATYYNRLKYSLKIGRDKLYTVQNVLELMERFLRNETHSYGKGFTFTHDLNSIDDKSYRLLRLSVSIANSSSNRYGYNYKKEFVLDRNLVDDFFELYKDEYVIYNGTPYLVKYDRPEITLTVRRVKGNRFNFKFDSCPFLIHIGKRGCFIDTDDHVFYMAEADFSKAIYKLDLAFGNNDVLYISEEDMQAFYTAVLKPLGSYVTISGLDKLSEYEPPEMICRLYIDTTEDGGIAAKMEYSYEDKIYPIFYERCTNPFCDHEGEILAEKAVLRYFAVDKDDTDRPLCITSESEIYRFMSDGNAELSRLMEIYTSDGFNRITVRPPAKTVVGIRPGTGSMLELEITADGYTMEELIALLGAYRKGKKYHRLKDGSFASVDDSIEELAEITESLNITDKALLKEKIKLPKYRMLYLDNLRNDCDSVRIERSKEFKKLIKEYRSSVDDPENFAVPVSLDDIMRDYQKYGCRWLGVIAGYGFGGILADDMGLGKTIQAIALILDYVNKNNIHKPSLVVCPSSLMLNWENELRKFAPQLNILIISGTSAARTELLGKMDGYDVIITSYSLIIRDIAEYEQIGFRYEFIDEAQYIKNHTTQMSKAVKGINADIRFALTGTPVENSLAELWSIFDFIMPGYLFNYNHFKKNYESPIVVKKDEAKVRALQKIVSPFILRRMKKDVLSELPDKTETVLRTRMDEEQSKVYSAAVAELKLMLSDGLESQSDRFRILSMLTRLRQICCDPQLIYENYSGGSAKLEQCLELVGDCVNSGHKILLFSQFTTMLDIIAKKLDEKGVSHYMLTGKTKPKMRMNLVNSFNEDNTQVFLISLKAGGTGLNLTGADIVIHYDPWWNVSAENQASDRVYRIGQKNNVQIYKLIAADSIEEKIIKLQESKSELFDIAVTGDGDIMRMDADDILGLLE